MAAKNNLARKLTNSRVPAFRTFAVSLNPDVAVEYERQAANRDTGAILSDRLEDPIVLNHTSDKALYFSDEDRQELEQLLAYNFNDAREVIDRLKSLFTVIRITDGDTTEDLALTPNQLFRLAERARMADKTVPQLSKDLAEQGINREIGLY